MKRLACFLLLLFVFTPCVRAADEDALYSEFDFDALYDAMGEDAKSALGSVEDFNRESISVKGLLSYVLSAAGTLIAPFFGNLSVVLGVLCVSSILRRLSAGFDSENAEKCVGYATVLALSLIVYKQFSDDLSKTKEFLESVQGYYASSVPIMTGMYALGGNTSLAAANGACSTVVLSIASFMCQSVVLPASRLCFALSLAGNDTVKLSPVSKAVSGFVTKLLSVTMGLVASGMLLSTTLAKSADGVGIRVLKFAASSFVPIVGGALSEATATLSESVRILRSSLGIFGIAAILYIILPVIVRVWVSKFSFSLAAGLADMLDCKREGALLKDVSAIYSLSLAALIGISLCLILALTVFVNTAAVR